MPSFCKVRMTRHAISPRLAIRTFLNMKVGLRGCGPYSICNRDKAPRPTTCVKIRYCRIAMRPCGLIMVGRKPRRVGSLFPFVFHPHAPGLSHRCPSAPQENPPPRPCNIQYDDENPVYHRQKSWTWLKTRQSGCKTERAD